MPARAGSKDHSRRRRSVLRRDNYRCVVCGCDDLGQLTLDHVVPRSKGGPNLAKADTVAAA